MTTKLKNIRRMYEAIKTGFDSMMEPELLERSPDISTRPEHVEADCMASVLIHRKVYNTKRTNGDNMNRVTPSRPQMVGCSAASPIKWNRTTIINITELIIKKTLSLAGLEIHRTPAVIDNPLHFNSIELTEAYYNNPENVKKYLEPSRIAFYHEIVDILIDNGVLLDQRDIADVGCGTGHLLKTLNENINNATLTGFDFSDAAIKIAKETCPDASFYRHDICNGSLNKFDVVLCTEVLEHLLYPSKVLQTLLKMVRHEGILLITVPDGRTDTYGGHINFWSPDSWKVFIQTTCDGFSYTIGSTRFNNNYAIIRG